MNKYRSRGWNWFSFLFGPFWYLFNGLVGKGIILLVVTVFTIGFGAPIIWIYCGLRGNSDLYERKLKQKSKIDINRM